MFGIIITINSIIATVHVLPWYHYHNQQYYRHRSRVAMVSLSQSTVLSPPFTCCHGIIITINSIIATVHVLPWYHYHNQQYYRHRSRVAMVSLSQSTVLSPPFTCCHGIIITINSIIAPIHVLPWYHYHNQRHYRPHSHVAMVSLSQSTVLSPPFTCCHGIIITINGIIAPIHVLPWYHYHNQRYYRPHSRVAMVSLSQSTVLSPPFTCCHGIIITINSIIAPIHVLPWYHYHNQQYYRPHSRVAMVSLSQSTALSPPFTCCHGIIITINSIIAPIHVLPWYHYHNQQHYRHRSRVAMVSLSLSTVLSPPFTCCHGIIITINGIIAPIHVLPWYHYHNQRYYRPIHVLPWYHYHNQRYYRPRSRVAMVSLSQSTVLSPPFTCCHGIIITINGIIAPVHVLPWYHYHNQQYYRPHSRVAMVSLSQSTVLSPPFTCCHGIIITINGIIAPIHVLPWYHYHNQRYYRPHSRVAMVSLSQSTVLSPPFTCCHGIIITINGIIAPIHVLPWYHYHNQQYYRPHSRVAMVSLSQSTVLSPPFTCCHGIIITINSIIAPIHVLPWYHYHNQQHYRPHSRVAMVSLSQSTVLSPPFTCCHGIIITINSIIANPIHVLPWYHYHNQQHYRHHPRVAMVSLSQSTVLSPPSTCCHGIIITINSIIATIHVLPWYHYHNQQYYRHHPRVAMVSLSQSTALSPPSTCCHGIIITINSIIATIHVLPWYHYHNQQHYRHHPRVAMVSLSQSTALSPPSTCCHGIIITINSIIATIHVLPWYHYHNQQYYRHHSRVAMVSLSQSTVLSPPSTCCHGIIITINSIIATIHVLPWYHYVGNQMARNSIFLFFFLFCFLVPVNKRLRKIRGAGAGGGGGRGGGLGGGGGLKLEYPKKKPDNH